MDNWGAFLFFAGWCFLGLLYVFFMVPEVSGLTVEEIDTLFKGPWFNAWRVSRRESSLHATENSDAIGKAAGEMYDDM
jgi:hypothetical protein